MVDAEGMTELVEARIEWVGGGATEESLIRPVARYEQLKSHRPRLRERVSELAGEGLAAGEIVERLNTEGYRPPRCSAAFRAAAVRKLRGRLGMGGKGPAHKPSEELGAHEWWLADLARAVGMPKATLYSWIGSRLGGVPQERAGKVDSVGRPGGDGSGCASCTIDRTATMLARNGCTGNPSPRPPGERRGGACRRTMSVLCMAVLYGVQPRTPFWQKAAYDPHSAAALFDTAVMFSKPSSDLVAYVPAGVVPDEKQDLLAELLRASRKLHERNRVVMEAHRPAVHEPQPRLIDLGQVESVAGDGLRLRGRLWRPTAG